MPWYAMEYLEGITLRQYSSCCRPSSSSGRRIKSPRSPYLKADSDNGPETTEVLGKDNRHDTPKLVHNWWTRSLVNAPGGLVPDVADHTSDQPEYETQTCSTSLEDSYKSIIEAISKSIIRESDNDDKESSNFKLLMHLTIIKRICHTLSFLHGEGVVHRDLKPDNVFIRNDGMPLLVDFGLMTQFSDDVSREKLEVEGSVMGTFQYMAPEQIQGHLVDARADLYALGCLMYELLTGKSPVRFGDRSELMRAHLHDDPVPPSSLCPEIPQEIDNLIMKLLIKAPNKRFGYASDVSAIVSRHCPEYDQIPLPQAKSYLYRPGFSGRDEVMTLLNDRLAKLSKNQGGIIFIGGESGVGKTRLLLETSRRAVQSGMLVLSGDSGSSFRGMTSESKKSSNPFEHMRKPLQTIGDICRELGQESTDQFLGPRGKIFTLYEASLADLPGWLHKE